MSETNFVETKAISPAIVTEPTNYVETASSFADSYISRGFNQFKLVSEQEKVQEVLKDMGLSSSVRSLNKDRVKNILAAYALYRMFVGLKTNIFKVGIVGLGAYLAISNKEKLTALYDSATEMVNKEA